MGLGFGLRLVLVHHLTQGRNAYGRLGGLGIRPKNVNSYS